MHYRPQHERRTHRREGERRLLRLHEVPRRFLRKGLGGAVAVCRVFDGFFFGDGVPVGFGVCVFGPGAFVSVDNGGEGRGYDDSLD